MKTTRAVVVFIVAMAAIVSIGRAQVEFIELSFQQSLLQTSAGATVTDPSAPFRFQAQVEGTGITPTSPLTAATVQLPGGGATYGLSPISHDSGATYQWRYQSGNYASLGALTSAYPASGGTYTVNLTGTPSGNASIVAPDFSATLLQAPLLTLGGGTWSGGTYYIAANQTLTVDFNPMFSGTPAGTQAYNYFVDFFGNTNSTVNGPNGFTNWDPSANSFTGAAAPATIPQFVINAGVLQTNQNYQMVLGYSDILSLNTSLYGGSVVGVASYEIRSTIMISTSAIPEPSTYAAIFGAVALAGVMIQRRRRMQAV